MLKLDGVLELYEEVWKKQKIARHESASVFRVGVFFRNFHCKIATHFCCSFLG